MEATNLQGLFALAEQSVEMRVKFVPRRLEHPTAGQRHGESIGRLGTAKQHGQEGVAGFGRQPSDPPLDVRIAVRTGQPSRNSRSRLELTTSDVNRLAIRPQRQRLAGQQCDALGDNDLGRIGDRSMNRGGDPTSEAVFVGLAATVHDHGAAGLLGHHAQNLQVQPGADAVTVYRNMPVAKPCEHLLEIIGIDQFSTAHAVTDVKHASGAFPGQGSGCSVQGRNQSCRAQWRAATQSSHGLANRFRAGQ